MSQLSDKVIADLWDWVEQYAIRWQEHFELGDSSAIDIKITRTCSADSIISALDEMSDWFNRYEDGDIELPERHLAMLYRGTILASDHSASAGIGMFPAMRLTHNIAKKPLDGRDLHSHQIDIQKTPLGHA
ncbi:MAG: hypothetical protein CUN52_15535, partial [Phototrophicales bacterium]